MTPSTQPAIPANCAIKLCLLLPFLRREAAKPSPRPQDAGAAAMIRHTSQLNIPRNAVYKCLMELHANIHLTDDEFFPCHVKAHIDRGAPMLEQEARYGNDLLIHLTEIDKGI